MGSTKKSDASPATDVPDPIGPPDLVSSAAGDDERDVVRRFADRGEETLHRIADLPGGSRALGAVAELGRRVDEMSRKARGVDELEARIARLEREVAQLRGDRPTA